MAWYFFGQLLSITPLLRKIKQNIVITDNQLIKELLFFMEAIIYLSH